MVLLLSPLEQFQIINFYVYETSTKDFSFTNFLLINFLSIASLLSFIYFNNAKNFFTNSKKDCMQEISIYLVPNSWQKTVELVSEIVSQLVSNMITVENEKYIPVVIVLFHFILFSNLIGLIPYTFTATSHLFVTFTLSFSIFIGINIMTFSKYKMKTFSLFLPTNTTFLLALLLVPVEFISYLAKPISLGVRLFVNLMAGHTLLKVIAGFSWSMLLLDDVLSIGLIFPLATLILLFGLELGIALIQAYVFIILTCIYIQDGTN